MKTRVRRLTAVTLAVVVVAIGALIVTAPRPMGGTPRPVPPNSDVEIWVTVTDANGTCQVTVDPDDYKNLQGFTGNLEGPQGKFAVRFGLKGTAPGKCSAGQLRVQSIRRVRTIPLIGEVCLFNSGDVRAAPSGGNFQVELRTVAAHPNQTRKYCYVLELTSAFGTQEIDPEIEIIWN